MREKLRRKLLVSPLTNRIYLTRAKPIGENQWEATADKEDFTEEALHAVMSYFIYHANHTPETDGAVKMEFDDISGQWWELTFRKKEAKGDGGNADV